MKKQVLSSAILAVLAANAHAVLPTIDPTTTTTVYISGASAQRSFIEKAIVGTAGLAAADAICDTTKPIWWWGDNNNAIPPATPAAGKNYDAWYCTKSAANPALASAKANLLIHKRSAGGSDLGVAPIITPAPIGFLNIANANCVEGTTTGTGTATLTPALCSAATLVNNTPDLGVSDVDPGQFVGKNVSAGFAATKPSDLANLTVKSTSTVVFGEQVTSHLFNALQAAQVATGQLPATCGAAATAAVKHSEACLPSLSSAVIADLHAGKVFDWDLIQLPIPNNAVVPATPTTGLWTWAVANAPADAAATSAVHIVRRANGSGTQTQHGIVFLNYPCDLTASGATVAANDVGQTEAVDGYVIHEMASSGNVNAALTALDTGTASNALIAGTNLSASTWAAVPPAAGSTAVRWAVGLNSLEQKTSTTTNYEFVKVDGVAPTLDNVVAGKYHDWVENTFQYNTAHFNGSTADVKAVVTGIVTKAAVPAVLSGLNATLTHSFSNGAYLAHPSNAVPTPFYNATAPVNVYTRAPNGVAIDNCRVPTVYNDGVNTPFLGL